MKTRYCSTLATLKWFMKIDNIVAHAEQSLLREKLVKTTEIEDPLTAAEMILIEDLIDALKDIDDATHFLGRSDRPTIQDVEIFSARIVGRLEVHIKKQSSISVIGCALKDDIISRP